MLAVAYSEGELRHLWVCNSWPSGDDGDGDGDNDDDDGEGDDDSDDGDDDGSVP